MNNNEFDNIIKESLEGLSVTPSSTVGKTLGRKMILKNIWFFHKTKALFILLIVGVFSISYFRNDFPTQEASSSSNLANNYITSKKNHNLKTNNNKIQKNNSLKSPTNNKDITKRIGAKKINKKELDKENKITEKLKTVNKNTTKNRNSTLLKLKSTETKSKQAIANTGSNGHLKGDLNSFNKQLIVLNKNENIETNEILKRNALPIENEIENEILAFEYTANENTDYVNSKKGIISIDVFSTPYNQTIIQNKVEAQYSGNWWDFYKEKGYVNSKLEAGARVNYDWKNIVVSTGLKLNKVIEYKPTYRYESTKNPLILYTYGLSEISGVQVNGIDSAHYVFYTRDDEELINKIENELYNTYSYLTIPLKLGYEFETSKFSILIQAGINYNKLIKAKGTYLKRYTNNETLDIYYNKGIETAILTRRNSMLKKSHLALIATIAGNVKISSSFDLFGEFSFQKSLNTITQEGYFVQKRTANFGTNFGVKYYLKPRSKNKTTLQEVF